MFTVDGKKITISRGDTGDIVFTLTGHTFTSSDRAIFTVANKNATTILMKEEYEITDGHFTVHFANNVTDQWTAGNYKWEIRVVLNPTREEGVITDGDSIITPYADPGDFVVTSVLADI